MEKQTLFYQERKSVSGALRPSFSFRRFASGFLVKERERVREKERLKRWDPVQKHHGMTVRGDCGMTILGDSVGANGCSPEEGEAISQAQDRRTLSW